MKLLRVIFAASMLAAAGCVSVSEGVDSLKEVDADSVLVVGKIEIVPPIKPEEQTYKANDPFNSKRHFIGRAVMFMSDKPKYAEHTGHALNPPLEQTYFVKVPRSQRYMVKGSVTMSFAMRVVSRREAVTEQTELLFPVPAELDIRRFGQGDLHRHAAPASRRVPRGDPRGGARRLRRRERRVQEEVRRRRACARRS